MQLARHWLLMRGPYKAAMQADNLEKSMFALLLLGHHIVIQMKLNKTKHETTSATPLQYTYTYSLKESGVSFNVTLC